MTPNLCPVEVDAVQVAQVVQNIVLNANEAMDGKGFHTTLCYKLLTTDNSLGIFRSHW